MVEISLAPMMKVTTPLFRLLVRKTAKQVVLFTEMIVSSTVVHADRDKLYRMLGAPESLTVVQLGGSCPQELAQSVKILKEMGWSHFNLNCGCPSNRVQNGKFGALLMLEKENVANIINMIYKETGVIISLKIRTGVDEHDGFDFFKGFVDYIHKHTPTTRFYVHARKCWLCGLNPKQNRNIPQLNYEFVYKLKVEMPQLFIVLNGGIKENEQHKINNLDGLMVGRYAQEDIAVFMKYENSNIDMKAVVKEYLEEGAKLDPLRSKLLMPLINLRKGKQGAKMFKQVINEIMHSTIDITQIYAHIEKYLDDL